ncbi:Hypothetical predicted protein [Marmota monax]|uniref:Uncharacterized protein n=1 Tax=Marmota monax TaxID=9995 RepID=A0A5E4BXI2_MARMO|nr:hypothetical protein GHT09_011613 [Marmota monax]VTJ74337.1 Hypothetical predicted protein [Marmota monax]
MRERPRSHLTKEASTFSHHRHHLPAGLEPSARPGPGPGRDLWRMTAEPPKGGEGIRHSGHSILVSFYSGEGDMRRASGRISFY